MGPYSALLDFSDPADAEAPRLRLAFGKASQVLVAHEVAQVRDVLEAVQAAALQGHWCVGYVGYEAAPAFDTALQVHAANGPLAWFAVYDAVLPWPQPGADQAPSPDPSADWSVEWHEPVPQAAFNATMHTLHRAIAQGEVYQVNYTAQMRGQVAGQTGQAAGAALFAALQRAQPGGYAVYLDTGATGQVLSVSPELFFDWCGGHVLTRPMKGTAPRGATPEQDAALAESLRTSAKERAENVMIVDLLRNDLSRIAQAHSVRVPRLFDLQALPSVWQMTSDVQAHTRPGCTLWDVFAALFPCGSVTGAPKVRAMQMIQALEPDPRGVYCGALGVVQPGGRATFNVPIRTVTLQGSRVQCGVGSGITADADAQGEWQEWQHKQVFVQRASGPFSVLETLALVNGVLRHADAHLERMALAARHFGTPWDAAQVRQLLRGIVQDHPQGDWRVRLLLDARGEAQAQAYALEKSPERVRLQLASTPIVQAGSEFVRFKTTRRAHYDAFAPAQPGVFDTVLWNTQGEITECTRGNIAVQLAGRWVTPALRCGLLNGVGRARALADGIVEEAVVHVSDLSQATAFAFVNSLRGWIDAELLWERASAMPGENIYSNTASKTPESPYR